MTSYAQDRRTIAPAQSALAEALRMKLVPKLSLAFIAGVSLVLAMNGYFRVKREIALFETDRARDDALIGEALASSMETVWKREGRDAALATLQHAAARDSRVRVRWVWLDGAQSLAVDRAVLNGLAVGEPMTRVSGVEAGGDRRFTFMRVAVPDARAGALEISESLGPERAYARRTVENTVLTALLLDAVCAVLAMVLGVWIVGRPMSALAAKARRIGAGDFGAPLRMKQRDEIAALADEMNAMCDQLVAANERAAREMQSRIAMLEQLKHADRLMTVGKLAAGVAHEIGTPLNVIEARATMLADGTASAGEATEFGLVIVRATERIARIIRQLLAFARRDEAHKTRCDLAVLAKHTVDLLESLATKRKVALHVADGGVKHPVDVDGSQIEQVLTNLVMNAIQATGGAGTVEISLDRTRAKPPPDHGGEEAEFERVRVRDEGHGIAPENLEHVFEPFFTTKEIGEGTGLGLSIAYGIVREHGGWISAESTPGRGSAFTFWLPTMGRCS